MLKKRKKLTRLKVHVKKTAKITHVIKGKSKKEENLYRSKVI